MRRTHRCGLDDLYCQPFAFYVVPHCSEHLATVAAAYQILGVETIAADSLLSTLGVMVIGIV